MAVANFSFIPLSNTLSIFLNTGTGSFAAATNYNTGTGTSGIISGDFNNDNKIDLATANRESNSVSILLGTGIGSFGAATNYTVGINPQEVITGDFNGDGILDLATANSTGGNTSILLGTGSGSFGATTNFTVGSGANDVICGDFSGDGKLDLILTCAGSSNTVNILLGAGNGSFSAPTSFPSDLGPTAVTSGDFNGDGNLDLALSNYGSGSGTLSLLFGTGTGSFGPTTNYIVNPGNICQDIISNDFNGDGNLDLAISNNNALNSVSIVLGDGGGNFATPFFLSTGGTSTPHGIASSDFNSDGKMDMATSNYITDNVSVFLNTGFIFNPIADTTRVCDTSITLDAGSGYATYNWNTGTTTQTFLPTTTGKYYVRVSNSFGCIGSDSTMVSIIEANIEPNDTTICGSVSLPLTVFTPGSNLAPNLLTRWGHGSVLIGAKIYIVGGDDPAPGFPAPIEIYDIQNNSWSLGANLNNPRGELVVAEVNGKIYAIGGYDITSSPTAYVNEYNPATNTWLAKAAMPTARSVMSGCAYNGKIYVAGGWPGNMNILEIYDPATNIWSTAAPMPTGRQNKNSMVALGGNLYFIGGKNDLNTQTYNDVYIYNISANSWSVGPSLPSARFGGIAVTDGIKIYYAGGTVSGGSSAGAQQSIYVFNPATNSWTLSPVQLSGTRFDFTGNLYKGRLYSFGGFDATNTPVAFSIKTDILTNTVLWSTASTANSINVTPINTSTYYATVTDGINSCTDSVKITVQDFLANLAAISGGSQVCKSNAVSGIGTYYIAPSCELIAKVQPSGASPVGGTINSCVIIDPSVQYYNAEPYVQRHYDIEPINNPASSSATVTLYFKDQEFVNFNAVNSAFPDLPTLAGGGNSDPNISKLRVTQYHGVPIAPHNVGNPAPGFYTTSSGVLITPSLVNYNSTFGYWEVTIQVNGFSGFYVHTNIYAPLPITLNYFNGTKQGANHVLNWKVTCNAGSRTTLILERSVDSRNFLSIYTVTADAVRCQQSFEYVDLQPLNGINYYRLKMVDAEGKITYSSIVALLNASKGFEIINTAPNPITGSSFKLNVASTHSFITEILIRDIQGRLMHKQSIRVIAGFNSIDINVSNLAAGSYIIFAITSEDKSKTFRFVKE